MWRYCHVRPKSSLGGRTNHEVYIVFLPSGANDVRGQNCLIKVTHLNLLTSRGRLKQKKRLGILRKSYPSKCQLIAHCHESMNQQYPAKTNTPINQHTCVTGFAIKSLLKKLNLDYMELETNQSKIMTTNAYSSHA